MSAAPPPVSDVVDIKAIAENTELRLRAEMQNHHILKYWSEYQEIAAGNKAGLPMTLGWATTSEYSRHDVPLRARYTDTNSDLSWIIGVSTHVAVHSPSFGDEGPRQTVRKNDWRFGISLEATLWPIWAREDGVSYVWADEPYAKGQDFTLTCNTKSNVTGRDGYNSTQNSYLTSNPWDGIPVLTIDDSRGDWNDMSFLDQDFYHDGFMRSHVVDMGKAIERALTLLDLAAKNYELPFYALARHFPSMLVSTSRGRVDKPSFPQ